MAYLTRGNPFTREASQALEAIKLRRDPRYVDGDIDYQGFPLIIPSKHRPHLISDAAAAPGVRTPIALPDVVEVHMAQPENRITHLVSIPPPKPATKAEARLRNRPDAPAAPPAVLLLTPLGLPPTSAPSVPVLPTILFSPLGLPPLTREIDVYGGDSKSPIEGPDVAAAEFKRERRNAKFVAQFGRPSPSPVPKTTPSGTAPSYSQDVIGRSRKRKPLLYADEVPKDATLDQLTYNYNKLVDSSKKLSADHATLREEYGIMTQALSLAKIEAIKNDPAIADRSIAQLRSELGTAIAKFEAENKLFTTQSALNIQLVEDAKKCEDEKKEIERRRISEIKDSMDKLSEKTRQHDALLASRDLAVATNGELKTAIGTKDDELKALAIQIRDLRAATNATDAKNSENARLISAATLWMHNLINSYKRVIHGAGMDLINEFKPQADSSVDAVLEPLVQRYLTDSNPDSLATYPSPTEAAPIELLNAVAIRDLILGIYKLYGFVFSMNVMDRGSIFMLCRNLIKSKTHAARLESSLEEAEAAKNRVIDSDSKRGRKVIVANKRVTAVKSELLAAEADLNNNEEYLDEAAYDNGQYRIDNQALTDKLAESESKLRALNMELINGTSENRNLHRQITEIRNEAYTQVTELKNIIATNTAQYNSVVSTGVSGEQYREVKTALDFTKIDLAVAERKIVSIQGELNEEHKKLEDKKAELAVALVVVARPPPPSTALIPTPPRDSAPVSRSPPAPTPSLNIEVYMSTLPPKNRQRWVKFLSAMKDTLYARAVRDSFFSTDIKSSLLKYMNDNNFSFTKACIMFIGEDNGALDLVWDLYWLYTMNKVGDTVTILKDYSPQYIRLANAIMSKFAINLRSMSRVGISAFNRNGISMDDIAPLGTNSRDISKICGELYDPSDDLYSNLAHIMFIRGGDTVIGNAIGV